ncbi:DUF202 domain-containing protein [Streptomyces sp. NPDC051776]|uniref:DUF202 domain-containing protein n=1 Tax=Streptomyces sp. NPDC051776 TaxID=3155414 RepID=UPI0034374DF1
MAAAGHGGEGEGGRGGAGGGGAGRGAAPRRDPGLQPERTRLAWRRTTLTYVAAGLLAAREVLHGAGPLRAAVTLAVGAPVLLGFLAVAHRRIRALDASCPTALSARTAAAAASCAIALAVLGAAAHVVDA